MRILIVEDDRKIADHLSKGLREAGYAVDQGRTTATRACNSDFTITTTPPCSTSCCLRATA